MHSYSSRLILPVVASLFIAINAQGGTTPNNSCGPSNHDYVCDPNNAAGGPCCSSAGYCGKTDIYCGQGCQPKYGNCTGQGNYVVPGVGTFTHMIDANFATASSLPSGLEYNLDKIPKGVSAKFNAQEVRENVLFANGYLVLKVPGGQNTDPIKGGAIETQDHNTLYGSVRVKAILPSEPGVCAGFFFYKNNDAEIDMEYLSDPASTANDKKPPPLQLTNHGPNGGNTHETVAAPADATSAVHEYRIDWTAGKVVFLVDGNPIKTFTTNVPSIGGTWIFNIWSAGDPTWSAGPPKNDAILRIQSIVAYYNTA